MINKIGIIGSGIMGQGIAQVFIKNNYETTIIDINEEILKNAVNSIDSGKYGLINLVNKNIITLDEKNKIMKNLKTSINYSDLSNCDLVIEAVPEILNLKMKVFENIEKNVNDNAIIASNTSGIMISKYQEMLKTNQG